MVKMYFIGLTPFVESVPWPFGSTFTTRFPSWCSCASLNTSAEILLANPNSFLWLALHVRPSVHKDGRRLAFDYAELNRIDCHIAQIVLENLPAHRAFDVGKRAMLASEDLP